MPFSAIVSTCLQHFHLENRIFLNSHFSLKFFWRMRFASLTAIKATLRCASMCVRVCVCNLPEPEVEPLSLPGSFPYSGRTLTK